MNTKQFNNNRKSVEEVVVRRKIFSESAPDIAYSVNRPETTDRIYDSRAKTHANYNVASTFKTRSKTAELTLPSIGNNTRPSNLIKHTNSVESFEEAMEREEENKELFDNVIDYCKILQDRVKELEIEKLKYNEEGKKTLKRSSNSGILSLYN